eukprot:g1899.t1
MPASKNANEKESQADVYERLTRIPEHRMAGYEKPTVIFPHNHATSDAGKKWRNFHNDFIHEEYRERKILEGLPPHLRKTPLEKKAERAIPTESKERNANAYQLSPVRARNSLSETETQTTQRKISRYLVPEPDFELTMDKVEDYFIDKIVNHNYKLEPKKLFSGPRVCQPYPVGATAWTDSTKLYVKSSGYMGDFRNPKSNVGYGRSPFGGFYTNFK